MPSAFARETLYPTPGSPNPSEPISGNKSARDGPRPDRTVRRSLDDLEPLVALRSHGDDDAASGRELLVERLRYSRGCRGDDDPVEWRLLGHTESAVTHADIDASVPGALERPPCFVRELGDALDRHDVVRELREECRLVAGAGADLERAAPLQPERLEHRRDHERLRDRLSRSDRQRTIGVGVTAEILRHEQLARDRGKGGEDSLVADPPPGHEPRQLRPLAHAFVSVRAYGGAGTAKWSSTAGITSTIDAGRTSSPTASIGISESPVRSDPCEPPPE